MSEADKLFYELGYEKDEKISLFVPTILVKYYEDEKYILFQKDKTIRGDFKITMQELKAINAKVKELGWSEL